MLSAKNTSLRPQAPESPWQHQEMQLVGAMGLCPVTPQLLVSSCPPVSAWREPPPLQSSLKDGLQNVFLTLQDSKVKGQSKLRARHHIAASASLRLPRAVPDASRHHKEHRKLGVGGELLLNLFPPPVPRVWNLPRAYRGPGVSDDSATSAAAES